jgi:hypothetical protein
MGWFAAADANRLTSPSIPDHHTVKPITIPVSAAIIHQLHYMADPIVSISNSLLIAFPIKEFLPLIAGYGDR